MTGVYLKCDECGAELGVESVPSLKNIHPSWGNKRELQAYARELGWTGPLEYQTGRLNPEKDLCPTCTSKAPSEEGR